MLNPPADISSTRQPARGWRPARLALWPAGVLLAAAVPTLIMAIVMTRAPVLGYRTTVLAGGSMEPSLHNGALLISKETPPKDLEVGDVITFRLPGSKTAITHRITAFRDEDDGQRWFTLKGDANQTADAEGVGFAAGTPYKTVTAIPYAGYALNFIHSLPGLVLLVLFPALGLAALQVFGRREENDRAPETPG